MTDLLPCPFCGLSDLVMSERVDYSWRSILCNECGARGPGVKLKQEEIEGDWNTRVPAPAQRPADPVQDTWLVGGPDLKAMSGSVESDRVIQLHFSRKATDADRKWLLDAINAKIAADGVTLPSTSSGSAA